ncbi:hypothetical protein TorRG33x02_259720 [Trema orientale]|uniref:Uncharacterized protein n=1 Tax=Trema orientale TaxID=63057 RepID=A0A2P5D781_TREOI|nr:hypothetical protein TorRG33x02_259720 [Trema orientale]
MECRRLRAFERIVANIISEMEDLPNKFYDRICEIKNLKDRRIFIDACTVDAVELAAKQVRRTLEDADIRRLKAKLLSKDCPMVWKRDNIQSLLRSTPVMAKIREFMKLTWKETAKKNRAEEQRSLIESMQVIWVRGKTTFDTLKTLLIDLGTRISMRLIEYFMLVVAVSSDWNEILTTLSEVETILRCLSVEENSLVINTFVFVVQFFGESIQPAKKILDNAEGKSKKTRENLRLCRCRTNGLLHLIIREVLRLEVSYCYPDMPWTMIRIKLSSKKTCLTSHFHFKESLENIDSNIYELKLRMLSIRNKGSLLNQGSLHQVIVPGVKAMWNRVEL